MVLRRQVRRILLRRLRPKIAERTIEGLVLRRTDSGESDRRLTLLSPDQGKLDVLAKGARKAASRLAGSSEPFTWAKFGVAEGKARRYVTQVELIETFAGLRSDYDRLAGAFALAEVLLQVVPYEAGENEFFAMAVPALRGMGDSRTWEASLVWALARTLVLEGEAPDWLHCAVTGAALESNPAWVSHQAQGPVLDEHAVHLTDRFRAPVEALIGLQRIAVLDAPPPNLRFADACLNVMHRWWRATLDSPLPALEGAVRAASASSE